MDITVNKMLIVPDEHAYFELEVGDLATIVLNNGVEKRITIDEIQDDYIIIQDTTSGHKQAACFRDIVKLR